MPWTVLEEGCDVSCPPREGDYWRMNFSRVEWEYDIINQQYKKKNLAEHNWGVVSTRIDRDALSGSVGICKFYKINKQTRRERVQYT